MTCTKELIDIILQYEILIYLYFLDMNLNLFIFSTFFQHLFYHIILIVVILIVVVAAVVGVI